MRITRTIATVAAGVLGLGALFAAGTPHAAEQSGKRDVVLVVDSTGVSDADWLIQKRAYLAMLDDRATFPLDGSIAVSFIQYAGTSSGGQASRVTVPLTVLDSVKALGTVTASIRAATLLAPEKAGVDGLSAAAQELSERGSKGSAANVCLTANAPWDPDTLAKGVAATKVSGATRLGVLALTSASLSESIAAQRFTSAIVGDGAITSVRDMPQFGSLVSSSCMLPALRLEAIEVNQVIQDWENSVPLVEHKDTIVRVFLETVIVPSTTVSGLLHGERDGVALSGSPLSPMNTAGSAVIDSTIDNETSRNSLSASLNFRLPTSWLSGDVTLTFEAPADMTCSAAPLGAQDCDVDVEFTEAEEPEVDYVSIPYEYFGAYKEPTDAALVENMYRTEDIFPTQYVDFDFDWLPWLADDTIPALEVVNAHLVLYSLYEDCWPGCAMYYGILDGGGGGLANAIGGSVASGFLSGTGGTTATGYARNRGPHEIAHMLGAHHVVNAAENGSTSRLKYGWCKEEAGTSAPEFPHWFYSTSQARDFPSLGPMGSMDEEIWGMAPRFADVSGSLTISNPNTVFPLMSYCGSLSSSSQWRWPSVQTYDVLTDELLTSRRAVARPAPRAAPTPQVVIRGLVDSDGTAEFLPVTPVTMSAPKATPGAWSIRLLDRRGKAIATRSFTLSEPHGDPAEPEGGEMGARGNFAVPFPVGLAARIASIQLLRGKTTVATERASNAAPRVSITAPKAGIALTGPTVTVSWAAQDADSVDLTATVLYRSGPRARWTPVAIDATGTSVTVPRRAIEGSRTGEFMVVANDGIRYGSARVGALRVADSRPIVSIRSGGDMTYSGAQNIILSAMAWDSEDGARDLAVTWTSSIDGALGPPVAQGSSRSGDSGFHINLLATDLSEGVHTISATATDSFGNTATESTQVTITRVADGVKQQEG